MLGWLQVKQELMKEHASTWRTNGLQSLRYKEIKRAPIAGSDHATLVTVDVMDNGHWSDTIKTWKEYQAKFGVA